MTVSVSDTRPADGDDVDPRRREIDPTSPGRWPADGPQPPHQDWMLQLDELTSERAVYRIGDPMERPAPEKPPTEVTISRSSYEALDRPTRLGVRMQMWSGA